MPDEQPTTFEARVAHVDRTRREVLARPRGAQDAALMQADIDFATDARRRGAAPAFAARMHPDGLLISPGDPVAFGPEAVAVALSGGQSEWHWTPLDARVSGDLGVTWGIAAIGWRDAQGQRQSVQTRYVTVWRRHAGEWRIWIDIGNPGPLP